jgi:hypothetical protein
MNPASELEKSATKRELRMRPQWLRNRGCAVSPHRLACP